MDDDSITLELLQHILEEFVAGQIWTFSSSIDAMTFIQDAGPNGPDLIISDWNMPDKNGIQVLQACRKEWPDTPFIMMTATATRDLVVDAKSHGVTDFLVKPFKNAEMMDKVEKWLGNI